MYIKTIRGIWNLNWENIFVNGIEMQKDEVGNLVQQSGAVKSKACQICKTEFDYKPTKKEKIQDVPIYKCEKCDFKNASGDFALEHKITSNHNIKKIKEKRLVGYDIIIEGKTAEIIKTEYDVKILCSDCFGNKY